MLLAIHGIIIVSLIALGIVFFCGKGAILIAGYNTSSPEEKRRIDKKKLCRFMGKVMFLLAGCWLVTASNAVFGKMYLLWLGNGLVLAVSFGAAIYASTGNRFER